MTRQLLDASERLGGSVTGVIEVAPAEVSRYGVIAGEQVEERAWRLSGLVEKPPVGEAPSNLAITGPYVLSPAIFEALASVEAGAIGEIQLTDGLDALAKREPVFAYRFEGERFDAGTPLGLIETAVELALRRPEMARELGPWIKRLAGRLHE